MRFQQNELRIDMFPMDYEEFRRALGDTAKREIIDLYTKDLRKDGDLWMIPVCMTQFL